MVLKALTIAFSSILLGMHIGRFATLLEEKSKKSENEAPEGKDSAQDAE